jgi:hypothetical protein
MELSSDEERWAVWMVQARRFAERENFPDAVARMRLVRDAIAKALGEATDSHRREQLEIELARAEEQLAILESKSLAWRSQIATRRQATIDQAEEEMAQPLPQQVD